MIVAALINLYFDHFLTTDDSWPQGFTIEFEDYRVNIEPRRAGEELFPEDIDRTLSAAELTLVPLSRPGGTLRWRMADRIVDRIKTTVVRENVVIGEDGSLPDDLEQKFLDAAVEAVDNVFAHLRVLSEALFVQGVRREYRLEDGQFYLMAPHTISWFAGDDPANLAPLGMYPGGVNATLSSGAIRAPERGAVSFDELSASITEHGPEPPLAESLLVTAQERITQLLLREAIIAAAMACEIASDQYLDQRGRGGDPDVQAIVNDRNLSFTERRFNRVPRLISDRSFKDEHPEDFADLQRLYRTRNNVAHAGELSYSEGNATINVGQRTALSFTLAAHLAVDWLRRL